MSEWTFDSGSPAVQASAAAAEGGGADETADRTSIITGRLKTIYRKSVLPVEKRFKYDYFYESPFMSDAEFDGTCTKYYPSKIYIYIHSYIIHIHIDENECFTFHLLIIINNCIVLIQ